MTWGSGGVSPPFLTPALDEGEWLAIDPVAIPPGQKASSTHCIGGYVDPRLRLDIAVVKREMSYTSRN
jgi:hypothetical protein